MFSINEADTWAIWMKSTHISGYQKVFILKESDTWPIWTHITHGWKALTDWFQVWDLAESWSTRWTFANRTMNLTWVHPVPSTEPPILSCAKFTYRQTRDNYQHECCFQKFENTEWMMGTTSQPKQQQCLLLERTISGEEKSARWSKTERSDQRSIKIPGSTFLRSSWNGCCVMNHDPQPSHMTTE